MNIIHRRRRGTQRVRIAIISLGLALGAFLAATSNVVEAAAEKPERGRKYRLVAEDIDNEGPIGRDGWGSPERLPLWHVSRRLNWQSPVRIELILLLKSLPRQPARRR